MTILPKKAKDVITRPIPSFLIKQKPGKAAASYISGNTVIDHLNEAFDYLWSFEITSQWVQPGVDKFNPKYDKEPQPQGPVAHVAGRLTIQVPQADGKFLTIVKEQFGSKAVIGGQMDQEHIFKAAGTDAMKKCASLVGIGLELYRNDDEQAFFDEMNYDDPWTDEDLERLAAERGIIRTFMDDFGLDADKMRPYLEAFSDGAINDIGDIVPSNIVAFTTYLQEVTAEADAAEAAEV